MMKLFDTHAHVLDDRFDGDRDAVLTALPEKGVARMIEVACHVEEAPKALALSERYPFIRVAVGMHPHEAGNTVNAHMDELRNILAHPNCVALGEIGLDYHYDFAPREVQRHWFDVQLSLAKELDLPVVIHSREASADCLDILRAHRDGLKGEMHCFSGSYETAKLCVDMGLYIAFGGALTFKKAPKQTDCASRLPLDRILIETDCPYMTPEPFRGRRNDPSLVRLVAEKLAMLRGMEPEEAAEITFANGEVLFGTL